MKACRPVPIPAGLWLLRNVFDTPTLERPASLNCYLLALSSPNPFCHHSFNPPSTSLSLFLSFLFALFPSFRALSLSKSTCHRCSLLSSIYMSTFLPRPPLFTSYSHSSVFPCLFISSHQSSSLFLFVSTRNDFSFLSSDAAALLPSKTPPPPRHTLFSPATVSRWPSVSLAPPWCCRC